ncbi:MAG: hypothetical protein OXC48_06845 [Endozoicomonadaceae bacterium]|nr:hypothetical protein [Endozoicomonadaceae bacterium]
MYSADCNPVGDLIWQVGEDSRRTWYTYLSDGKPKTVITPAGNTISWQYNILGLPVSKSVDKKQLLQIKFDYLTKYIIQKSDLIGITSASKL